MRHEESIDIAATADIVWSVLTDVERWPEWTASMTRVERLDHGPFAIGSRVRIKQPKLPATVWEVTALAPERSFSWTAKSPGATTVADHELRSAGDAVTVTLRTRQDGPVGRVLGRLISSLTRRYVGMEARGLKQRSEVTASS